MAQEQFDADVIIIGAGPTGLTAATYASREGLSTMVVEKAIAGGLAVITDQIDNYPGFPDGISGPELAERLEQQAIKFGAKMKLFTEVIELKRIDDHLMLVTGAGELTARAVLIATGSSYKKLDVPGEQEQIGKRIHFCATCDGPLYRDKEIVVVGGGNSAVQEAVFLAKFASKITMLVRADHLKASEVLNEVLLKLPNVEVHYNVTTTSISQDDAGKFSAINAHDTLKDEDVSFSPDGVFVFVGLLANTAAFTMSLAHDDRNFLLTDAHYQTELPGVFVAGDVRSGSTWQIAAAVGEGASAALAIREYLEGAEVSA